MNHRNVLLTGGTGFLGKQIYQALANGGAHVARLGRSSQNEIRHDLGHGAVEFAKKFDIVIHNAGKAHTVPTTASQKQSFFNVNVTGTANLLKSFGTPVLRPDAIVFISSVSVYGLTRGENITEERRLSSRDAYGMSKIKAENLLLSWCEENKIPLTILRLPLVAGPDPPGNLGAMIRGISRGYYFNIAGGSARKSMVMASDVAAIIPAAVANPGIYHLTDGHHPSFKELGDCIARQLNIKPPRNIGGGLAEFLGLAGSALNVIFPGKAPISKQAIAKLTSTLTFDDTKARDVLGWNPHRVIDALRLH